VNDIGFHAEGAMKPLKGTPRLFLPTAILLLGLSSSATLFGGEPQPKVGQKLGSAQVMGGGAPPRRGSPSSAGKYRPGELLVRFRRGIAKVRIEALHSQVRAAVVKHFRVVDNLQLVRLPAGERVEDAIRAYRQNPEVLYAEPNYIRTIDQSPLTPNDPRFAELWGLHNTGQNSGTPGADIHAPEAWGPSTGSSNVVVGVIDTGVDYNHEDLSANMFRNPLDCNSNGIDDDGNGYVDDCYGIDTANGDSDPMDDHFHGTHVAGTIGAAGNNGIGVVGVNWQVSLMACKFLDSSGAGFDSDAIACLEYLAMMKDRGVNIVATNNSWGGGGYSQALFDAIDLHRQRGILFIASAGNSGRDADLRRQYPSNYYLPNIIAVAATDRNDALASFSNFGRHTVHLGAPGAAILSTVPGNSYASFSGTSMAAPHVTGVAALLKAQDPSRDWKAIKNLILAGGDTIPSVANTISQKRLNAYGAMSCSNSTLLTRVSPIPAKFYVWPGETRSLDLAVLHINCASPNGDVQVSIDGGAQMFTLYDEGLGTDQEAGDGIYSGQITWDSSDVGTHTMTFPGGDSVTLMVVPELMPYQPQPGVSFNYRSIAGTNLNLVWDTWAEITPPFPIQFGGASFSTVNISSEGFVTFPRALVGTWDDDNWEIPTNYKVALVAPFWDALDPIADSPANIYWDVLGSAPNRELVIEWRNVPHFWCGRDPSVSITFQIVFFEGSSDILFNYSDVFFGDLEDNGGTCLGEVNAGDSATVGVQSMSKVGTQFSYWMPSLSDNFSILWQVASLTPSASEVKPFSAVVGDVAFTLEVTGANFLPTSVVRWNGSDRPTTFVSMSKLTASIPASDLATAGTAQITVFSPPPSGAGESNGIGLPVYSQNPVPQVAAVGPNPAEVCGPTNPGLVLFIAGTNFVPTSVVRWNGADRSTARISSTQLRAGVPYEDCAAVGTAQVTAFNPLPGGGTSNPVTVQINNGLPAMTNREPDSVVVGGPAFTLSVYGMRFVSSSVVRWNGSDRPTTYVDYYHLTAAIPASDIATSGTAEITVFNPPPGGGTSGGMPVLVGPAFPLVVTKTGTGTGSVTSPYRAGIDCGTNCSASYVAGTVVTLTATPTPDSTFAGWSGDCAGMDTCTVTMDAARNVTATFNLIPEFEVLVICQGPGTGTVTSSPPGMNCRTGCTVAFPTNTVVILSAVADPGSIFTGWGGGTCSGTGTCSLTMNQNYTVGAAFTVQLPLSVTKSGNGSGNVTSNPAGIDCGATCSASFTSGTVVTLTATPATGSTFGGWGGGTCSGTGACAVTMTAAHNVTATFDALTQYPLSVSRTGTGTGAITSNPTGINCGATCSAVYNSGTAVTLTPAAGSGSVFAGWSGDCSGTGVCVVTMNAAKSVTATFDTLPPTQYALSVSSSGTGTGVITSNPTGINCGATCSAGYVSGTVVTLTATPAPGSDFAGWTGDCTGTGACVVTMNPVRNVGATFNLLPSQFNVQVIVEGSGIGTVTSSPPGVDCGTNCTTPFPANTGVSLSALAAPGSVFAGWGGACSGTGACSLDMSQNYLVRATFNLVSSFRLTVTRVGTGSGAVMSTPAAIDCGSTCFADFNDGTQVSLTPSPAAGSLFAGWSGDCTGTGACMVTMNAVRNINATFNLIPQFTLTVTKAGTGAGTVTSNPAGINCGATCSASFTGGTVVVLAATPANVSAFVGWSGDCSGAGTCTVTVAAAKNVTATFDPVFSISPAPGSTTSATVNAGQTASYSLSLAGTSGFNGSVSLACSGAPNAAYCGVSPSTLTLNGTTPVAATVTVTTTARAALPPLGGPPNAPLRFIPLSLPVLLALAALLFFGLGSRSRRFPVRTGAFALTTAFVVLLLSSCGGGSSGPPPPPPPPPGTQAGTYTITVTAISGGASHTLPLTLTVR
jgi:subtilisin family serine protease